MSARQIVVMICDVCEQEETQTSGVETRRVAIDAVAVEAEVCDPCYVRIAEALAVFVTRGRPVPARTKLRSVKNVPGTGWRFTSHALIRCGERNLDPAEIVLMLDDPSITRPGKASDQEIRERGGIKAVVVPERGIVVTVARKGEEAVDAYVEGRVG